MQTIRGPNPGDALGEGSHYTLVAQHRGAKVHLCMYQIDVAGTFSANLEGNLALMSRLASS